MAPKTTKTPTVATKTVPKVAKSPAPKAVPVTKAKKTTAKAVEEVSAAPSTKAKKAATNTPATAPIEPIVEVAPKTSKKKTSAAAPVVAETTPNIPKKITKKAEIIPETPVAPVPATKKVKAPKLNPKSAQILSEPVVPAPKTKSPKKVTTKSPAATVQAVLDVVPEASPVAPEPSKKTLSKALNARDAPANAKTKAKKVAVTEEFAPKKDVDNKAEPVAAVPETVTEQLPPATKKATSRSKIVTNAKIISIADAEPVSKTSKKSKKIIVLEADIEDQEVVAKKAAVVTDFTPAPPVATKKQTKAKPSTTTSQLYDNVQEVVAKAPKKAPSKKTSKAIVEVFAEPKEEVNQVLKKTTTKESKAKKNTKM